MSFTKPLSAFLSPMADANFIPEEQQHPALYTLKSESEESKHMKLY